MYSDEYDTDARPSRDTRPARGRSSSGSSYGDDRGGGGRFGGRGGRGGGRGERGRGASGRGDRGRGRGGGGEGRYDDRDARERGFGGEGRYDAHRPYGGRGARGGGRGGRGGGGRGGESQSFERRGERDSGYDVRDRGDERGGFDRGGGGMRGGRGGEAAMRGGRGGGEQRRGRFNDEEVAADSPSEEQAPKREWEGGTQRNDTGAFDWNCGACGASNFAKRTACFRCGAGQGAEAGAGPGMGGNPADAFADSGRGEGSSRFNNRSYNSNSRDEAPRGGRGGRGAPARDGFRRDDGYGEQQRGGRSTERRDDRSDDRSDDRGGGRGGGWEASQRDGGRVDNRAAGTTDERYSSSPPRGERPERSSERLSEPFSERSAEPRRPAYTAPLYAPDFDRESYTPAALGGGMSRFYATCHPGLEKVVAAELSSELIGAVDVQPGASGVSFAGSPRVGYLANLWLRSAIRVLVEMHRGWLDPNISGGQAVYDFVRGTAPWEEVVPRDGELTFSVESRVWSCTDVTSTRMAAIRAKDAICDALVDAQGWRPQPPVGGHATADVPLFLSLYRDEAVMYRDMSG